MLRTLLPLVLCVLCFPNLGWSAILYVEDGPAIGTMEDRNDNGALLGTDEDIALDLLTNDAVVRGNQYATFADGSFDFYRFTANAAGTLNISLASVGGFDFPAFFGDFVVALWQYDSGTDSYTLIGDEYQGTGGVNILNAGVNLGEIFVVGIGQDIVLIPDGTDAPDATSTGFDAGTQGAMDGYDLTIGIESVATPEPASLIIFGAGALGLVAAVRRKRQQNA